MQNSSFTKRLHNYILVKVGMGGHSGQLYCDIMFHAYMSCKTGDTIVSKTESVVSFKHSVGWNLAWYTAVAMHKAPLW